MKMLRVVWLYVLIAAFAISVSAQQKSVQHPNQDVRISKSHPTVYISFVKAGQAEPLYTGESNERIWLKLHNNTRWKLRLDLNGSPGKAYGVEIPYSVKTTPRDREIIMFPRVRAHIPPGVDMPEREAVDTSESRKDDCDQLDFFHGGHLFTLFKLQPGKSLIFTVPREYLCKRSYICVNYEYEWELDSQEPEHKVCFYGYEIPEGNKQYLNR